MAEKLKDCPDCKLEDQIADLLYAELITISKPKARELAKKIAKLIEREVEHG